MTGNLAVYSGQQWFQRHFGFTETAEEVYKHIRLETHPDRIDLISDANNRRISAGLFNLRTPSSYAQLPMRGGGHFHIIQGRGGEELNDINLLQNHPDFDGATFQVASNFNCLEVPSHSRSAADGISGYAIDYTQGPACVTPTPGGVMYRNYFVPVGGCVGQIEKDVNLLEKCPIEVVHGKAIIRHPENLPEFDWADEENYQVGVHENMELTLKRAHRMTYVDAEPGRMVHHVLASSFSLHNYVRPAEKVMEIVGHMLKSEYKTTLLAATDHSIRYPSRSGSRKCVLTLIGGGVFLNPLPLVCGAIEANEELIVGSGLDVYLQCYNRQTTEEVKGLLTGLVTRTGGSFIEPTLRDGPLN